MKKLSEIQKIRKSAGGLILLIAFGVFGNIPLIYAHGGENHGDSQPKTTAGTKGIALHTARLGDLEVMVKHPLIEPDAATPGRLFITSFQTNAAADKVNPALEIESANGSVTPITVEKTDAAGSYNLKIPALPAGTYAIRARISYAGETDTVTFSAVQIETAHAAVDGSSASWGRTALIALSVVIVLALFGGLIYYAARAAKGRSQTGEEAVSV